MVLNILTAAKAKVLQEANEKEFKQFRVYCNYRKNFKIVPVTGKFYSKFETSLDEFNEAHLDDIVKEKSKAPKTIYERPNTSNQEYGWYDSFLALNRSDTRLFHPKNKYAFIDHEHRIMNDQTMKLEKFTGIPWH